jgi:hypothetical protein
MGQKEVFLIFNVWTIFSNIGCVHNWITVFFVRIAALVMVLVLQLFCI